MKAQRSIGFFHDWKPHIKLFYHLGITPVFHPSIGFGFFIAVIDRGKSLIL